MEYWLVSKISLASSSRAVCPVLLTYFQWAAAYSIKSVFPEHPTNPCSGTQILIFMKLDKNSRNSYSKGCGNTYSWRILVPVQEYEFPHKYMGMWLCGEPVFYGIGHLRRISARELRFFLESEFPKESVFPNTDLWGVPGTWILWNRPQYGNRNWLV